MSPPALRTLALALVAPSVAPVGRAEYVELGFLVHAGRELEPECRALQPNFGELLPAVLVAAMLVYVRR